MTCASCANHIEKRLNRMEGVEAAVNFATEQARVTYGAAVTPEDLVAQVEATGYHAALPVVRTRWLRPQCTGHGDTGQVTQGTSMTTQ